MSEEAERGVLSGMLHGAGQNAWHLAGLVTGGDFAFWHHARVWEGCWAVWDGASDEVPLDALWRWVLGQGIGADLGGPCWLADLYLDDPTGASCAYHARTVRWLSLRRQAVHRAREAIADAVDGRWGPADIPPCWGETPGP